MAGCQGDGTAEPPQSQYVQSELPRGSVGYFVEGTLARESGDDEVAVRLLERAVQENDELILANQALGEIYRERENYDRAEYFFTRLVDRDPQTGKGHFLLASIYELTDRLEQAITSYLRGLEFEPDSFVGNLGVGRSLVASEQSERAVPYLERAVAAQPDSGEAWLTLGIAQDNAGDASDAEAAYSRAVELLPRDSEAFPSLLVALATNQVRQGRGAEAVPLLEEALELRPTPRTRKLLGDAHAAEGETRRVLGDRDAATSELRLAVEQYDRVLEQQPDYVEAINAKGAALLRLWQLGGRIDTDLRDTAIAAWQRSLELEPDQPAVADAVRRFGGAGVLD